MTFINHMNGEEVELNYTATKAKWLTKDGKAYKLPPEKMTMATLYHLNGQKNKVDLTEYSQLLDNVNWFDSPWAAEAAKEAKAAKDKKATKEKVKEE